MLHWSSHISFSFAGLNSQGRAARMDSNQPEHREHRFYYNDSLSTSSKVPSNLKITQNKMGNPSATVGSCMTSDKHPGLSLKNDIDPGDTLLSSLMQTFAENQAEGESFGKAMRLTARSCVSARNIAHDRRSSHALLQLNHAK